MNGEGLGKHPSSVICGLCVQVPLTAVLLLFELTHDYFIIIPTLASVGISYWVASFPMAALLQPLSPVFRLWPSEPATSLSSSTQARAVMTEEVFAAVSDAISDPLPLDQEWRPEFEDAPPQLDVTQEASEGLGEPVVTIGTVPLATISKNGLLSAGHPGRIRSLGRGGGASVSFSGSSVAASEATTNGTAPQIGDDRSSRGVWEGVDGEVGLVGSLPLRAKDREVEDLTVLCALRQACVMLTPDTSLGEALQVSQLRSQHPCQVEHQLERISVLQRALQVSQFRSQHPCQS